MQYFETSALKSSNLNELFLHIAKEIKENLILA